MERLDFGLWICFYNGQDTFRIHGKQQKDTFKRLNFGRSAFYKHQWRTTFWRIKSHVVKGSKMQRIGRLVKRFKSCYNLFKLRRRQKRTFDKNLASQFPDSIEPIPHSILQ